jgi:hypothetical protein
MDKKVDEYIEKIKSPQREICNKLRKIIFKNFPGIKEEMKWGVPSYNNEKFYFVALKTHVNLGFSLKHLSNEEKSLFDDVAKTMGHIEIDSLKNLNEKRIIKLMKMIK